MYELLILLPVFLIILIITAPELAAKLSAIASIILIVHMIYIAAGPGYLVPAAKIIFASFFLSIYVVIFLISMLRIKSFGPPDEQVLVNYALYGACFSFEKGVVVNNDDWDLMLNLPNGLASNNVKLRKNFKRGGIYDLGQVNFDDISQASDVDYQPALGVNEIIEGHCYLVKTSSGLQVAKILITKYNDTSGYIKFRWRLADDSLYFTKKDTEGCTEGWV